MARTIGSDGGKTASSIREAAAALIARHGFAAMSMRQLAAQVGVQAAALYRYFPTKEDLLFTLMREHLDELAMRWLRARPTSADPVARLSAFIRNHVEFSIERRHATHVCNMELRSLSRERLSLMLKLRGGYEKELGRILRDGAEGGVFRLDDTGLTTMAIIQMITGVIVWFRPDERLSPEEVADTYLAMTLRLLGASTAPTEKQHVHEHA